MSKNSLGTKKNLTVAGKDYEIFDISTLAAAKDLPFSLKILLENLQDLIKFQLKIYYFIL